MWQKQMLATTFYPQRWGVGQKGPAGDVKSDTGSKSAAPALLCGASCSGLILSESMWGRLGPWHTSRDAEQLLWGPTHCCCCWCWCCRCQLHQSGLDGQRKNKRRGTLVNNILERRVGHHVLDNWLTCLFVTYNHYSSTLSNKWPTITVVSEITLKSSWAFGSRVKSSLFRFFATFLSCSRFVFEFYMRLLTKTSHPSMSNTQRHRPLTHFGSLPTQSFFESDVSTHPNCVFVARF